MPTEAELDQAGHRLEEFYKKQVFIADQEWERTHNYMVITDVQRRAARGLGLEKDWSYEPKPLVDCLPGVRRKREAGRGGLPGLRGHPGPRQGAAIWAASRRGRTAGPVLGGAAHPCVRRALPGREKRSA